MALIIAIPTSFMWSSMTFPIGPKANGYQEYGTGRWKGGVAFAAPWHARDHWCFRLAVSRLARCVLPRKCPAEAVAGVLCGTVQERGDQQLLLHVAQGGDGHPMARTCAQRFSLRGESEQLHHTP